MTDCWESGGNPKNRTNVDNESKTAIESEAIHWIARANAGDMGSLLAIYTHHGGRLLNAANRILRDKGDAHDVVIDVLLKIHDSPPTNLPTRNGVAWLCKLARNRALDVKKRSTQVVLQADMRKLNVAADEPHAEMDLSDLLSPLDPTSREIVKGRIVDGRTHREIAASLSMNSNTVRRRYQQALGVLRSKLRSGEN